MACPLAFYRGAGAAHRCQPADTDWSLTSWGALLTVVGGYGAAAVANLDVLSERWLVVGKAMLLLSGAMWLCILVPLQVRMARIARRFGAEGTIPPEYRRAGKAWFILGIAATVPLVVAVWIMVAKPV